MGINILSLFDGMSCAQIAFERANIKVDSYYASEIDKYAISITQKNYHDTVQLGSVIELDTHDLQKIDIVIGGSPCQSFSIASKMRGMVTKCNKEITSLDQYLELKGQGFEFEGQSYLFWEYVRIINEVKPKYFILENVRVQKKWREVFNNALCGIKPVLINSALVSAQNRNRYYWVGELQDDGKYKQVTIPQPEDKGILLRDILIDGESYCLNGNMLIERPCKLKESPSSNHVADATDVKGISYVKRVHGKDGKTPTLTTCTGGHTEPKVLCSKKTYRKLTPLECERLQTVPDNYTEGVSNSQRYRMLGNGFTVDVIAHILQELNDE